MENEDLEEIDLKKIFLIMWRRKAVIAIVTVLTILIVSVATIILPEKVYQAQTVLQVSEKSPQSNIDPQKNGTVQNILNNMVHSLDMDFGTYSKDVLSEEVLEATIDDLKLKDKYTPEALRKKIQLTPDEVSQTITIRFNSTDPKEPAKIVNTISTNFIEYISKQLTKNSEELLTLIKEQKELEKQKYEETLKKYEELDQEYISSYEYELEVEGLYEQLGEAKISLGNLKIEQEGLEAAIKENNKSSQGSGATIIMPNGEGNIYLESTTKALAIDLANVKGKVAATQKSIKDTKEEIKKTKLNYQKIELDEIDISHKLDISKETYESFSQTYEELIIITSSNIGGASVTTVFEPEKATIVGSNTKLKLIMITFIGIILGVLASFIWEYVDNKKVKK